MATPPPTERGVTRHQVLAKVGGLFLLPFAAAACETKSPPSGLNVQKTVEAAVRATTTALTSAQKRQEPLTPIPAQPTQPPPRLLPTPTEQRLTDGWQVFKDQIEPISFRYPPGWRSNAGLSVIREQTIASNTLTTVIGIFGQDIKPWLTLEDITKKFDDDLATFNLRPTTRDVIIAGHKGKLRILRGHGVPASAYFVTGNKLYSISLNLFLNDGPVKENYSRSTPLGEAIRQMENETIPIFERVVSTVQLLR